MTLKELLASMTGDGKELDAEKVLEFVTSEEKGLSDKNKELLEKLAKAKGNQLPEDFDPDAFAKYLSDAEEFAKKQKELEDKELEDKGQWEALREKLVNGHSTAIGDLTTSKDGEISTLRGALDKTLIENAAIKAIDAEEGNSFFLLPHLKPQIKTVETDGAFGIQVVDSAGEARMNDEGKPFTVKELVNEMKANDQFAPAFPIQNGGTGNEQTGGTNGHNSINPWKKDSRNVTLQAKITKENPNLAAQMKKTAGVAA